MRPSRHLFISCAGMVMAAGAIAATAAVAGTTRSTAYFQSTSGSGTYLVEWQPRGRARVVTYQGAAPGSVASSGSQRIVTLDVPISALIEGFMDDCGNIIQQRKDLNQFAVRDLDGGISQTNEIGSYTNIGGCQDGLTTPFGSPDDPGTSLKRLSMAARPPVSDLVPGTKIAGFSEDQPTSDNPFFQQDVVTLKAGGKARFQTSGHVLPYVVDANQWLVFTLSDGLQRGFTRLLLDGKTGGETWLMSAWVDGQPADVRDLLFVKPEADAGFGSVAEASRMWESGLFVHTRQPFFIYLYKNGTGERVRKDLDLGTETRAPIDAWGFEGVNIVQHREFDGGALTYDRTWAPLRNESKVRWVMESEVRGQDGIGQVIVKPRVNYYRDMGKAVQPAAR
jgi:hypothetical protein